MSVEIDDTTGGLDTSQKSLGGRFAGTLAKNLKGIGVRTILVIDDVKGTSKKRAIMKPAATVLGGSGDAIGNSENILAVFPIAT
jgi:hypothetical protein